jgi:hypothetical protein
VAVHWSVSGIGCSDSTCGTIDEHGVYRTPSSLPRPRVVTLEGVLVSDPNYSVLTEVRLEDVGDVIVSPVFTKAATVKLQASAAPVIGRENVTSRDALPSLPGAVEAAPVIETRTVASNGSVPPLPNAVAPAPVVSRQIVSGPIVSNNGSVLPLPNVIPPAPEIRTHNVAGKTERPPLPKAVGPAPALSIQIVASTSPQPPLTKVIAPAPRIEKQSVTSSTASLPTPTVIAAAPEVPRPSVRSGSASPPLPNAVAAAPAISEQKVSSNVATLALSSMAMAPVVKRPSASSSSVLLPMPDVTGTTSVGKVVSAQHGPTVTYRDGQLTIDAENATLATVLELVAEKTGAVIEVPPGTGLERIFEHTGPGQPNDVLTQLLNGSSFDFIIVNSPERPREPAQVLLSLRQAETPGPVPAPAQPAVNSSVLWTPPPEAPPSATVVIDNANLTPPKEPLSPDDLEKMMKERSRQIREQIQQQQPQQ